MGGYPFWKKGAGGKRAFIKREHIPKLVFFQDVGNNQVVMTFSKTFHHPSLHDAVVNQFHGRRIDQPKWGQPYSGKHLFAF